MRLPDPRKGITSVLTPAVFLLLLQLSASAQTPAVTLSAASITIDPTASDSYDLRGSFDGLAFNSAQFVTFSIGQFVGVLPMSSFVQNAGTNVFVYQDSTGLAPFWLSSLTIDLDAQTFSAQATGIALAGLVNPFAVQFGTENGVGCTMARIQAAGPTTFRLNAGDGFMEPCQIQNAVQVSPPSFLVGEDLNVRFYVTLAPTAQVDPGSVQLFRADANAQAVGDPLCTLRDSGSAADADAVASDGIYSCMVHFNESQAGSIPLLVQATAGSNRVLAPGLSVLVVPPISQADVDAISAVETAASSSWEQSFGAYGDTFQARIQTLLALRGLPGIQEVGLLDDGLSIGILYTSGVNDALVLNRFDDGNSADGSNLGRRPVPFAGQQPGARDPNLAWRALTPAANGPACGLPQRPVVQNNKVLIWDAYFFRAPRTATLAESLFNSIPCPLFRGNVEHVTASVANAATFNQYGTIIIDTHGSHARGDAFFVTSDPLGEPPPDDPDWGSAQHGDMGAAFVVSGGGLNRSGWYRTISSAFFAQHGPYGKTIVYAAACSSAQGGMASVFTAHGGAYYGFINSISGPPDGFAEQNLPPLFNHLLKDYLSVNDSYNSSDILLFDPGYKLHFRNVVVLDDPGCPFSPAVCQLLAQSEMLTRPVFVLGTQTPNLAYLGNPSIVSPSGMSAPFSTDSPAVLNLKAQLDGALSCDQTMHYAWSNSAGQGHLTTPQTGAGMDNFDTTSSAVTYTPIPTGVSNLFAGGQDNLMVDFLPSGMPPPAARACAIAAVRRCVVAIGGTVNQKLPCTVSASKAANGNWTLQLATTGSATQPYAAFQVTLATQPAAFSVYGTTSAGILSASEILQPAGKGTSPTLTMNVPGGPNDLFVLNVGDLADPLHPSVDIDAQARDPKGPSIANCSMWGCSATLNWGFN